MFDSCNINVVYVYSEQYYKRKDSLWLNRIMTETTKILGFPKIIVNWQRDSIVSIIVL